MNFMQEVALSAKNIWEQSANESFLTEMGNGTLNRKQFLDYIVQDSIYLRDYLKAYAMAMFKCRTLKEMQVFYSVLGFVNDSENATRLKYLEDNNMTDDDVENVQKKPECAAYTKFLIDAAVNYDVPEILMAVMPCMFGYYDVFMLVRQKYPQVIDSYFGGLVADYTSKEYAECCDYWMDFTNDICKDLSDERKKKLKEVYLQASMHELYFWQMAGKTQE